MKRSKGLFFILSFLSFLFLSPEFLQGQSRSMWGQISRGGCNNGPDVPGCDECDKDVQGTGYQGSGGRVSTRNLNYHHDVVDYGMEGRAPEGLPFHEGLRYLGAPHPSLKVERMLRSMFYWPAGHFGYHTTSNYEYRVSYFEGPTWKDLYLYKPDRRHELFVSDQTGQWTKKNGESASVVEYFDQSGGVVFRRHDGTRLVFEWFGTFTYDELRGRLVRMEDRNGNGLDFAFDHDEAFKGWDLSKPTSVTDPFGRSLTFDYTDVDGYQYIASISLPDGRKIVYFYDHPLFRAPTRIIYPDGTMSQRWVDEDQDGVFWAFNDVVGSQRGRKDRLYRYDMNGAARGIRTVDGHLKYTGKWELQPDWTYKTSFYFNGVELETFTDGDEYLAAQVYPATGTKKEYKTDHWLNRINVYTDPLGRKEYYEHDDRGNVTLVTYGDNSTEIWQYNLFDQVTEHTDPMGLTTFYAYDGKGNLLRVDHPDGTSERWEDYNDFGRPAVYYDKAGNISRFEYNDHQDLTRVILPDGNADPGDNPCWEYLYDEFSRLLALTDPDGFTATYTYDGMDRVVKVEYADGTTEEILYGGDDPDDPEDPAATSGLVVARIDRNGNRRDYVYDAGDKLTMVYDPVGQQKAPPGSKGPSGLEKNLSIPVERGCIQHIYDYDTEQLIATLDHGDKTAFAYDETGHLVETRQHVDASTVLSTSSFYDAAGNLAAREDPYGFCTEYEYDQRNRLVETKRYIDLGMTAFVTTSTAYHPDGSVAGTTDENGNTIQFNYDLCGCRMSRTLPATTDPDGDPVNPAVERQVKNFDGCGRVAYIDYWDGGRTEYAYDAQNRVALEKRYLDTGHTLFLGKEYAYTPSGNIESVTMRDEHGVLMEKTLYTYTCDGLVETERKVMSPDGVPDDAVDLVTHYAYDGNGNLLERTDPEGHADTFTYDERNRIRTETNGLGVMIAAYTYLDDAASFDPRLGGASDGSAVITKDALGHTQIAVLDGIGRNLRTANPLDEHSIMFYDQVEGGLVVTRSVNVHGNVVSEHRDGLNRLRRIVQESAPGMPAVHYEHDYNFNGTGHARNLVTDPLGNTSVTRTNQRNEWILAATPAGEASRFEHDQMGRMARAIDPSGGETLFEYDPLGRLLFRHEPLGRTTAYAYDGSGRVKILTDGEGYSTSFSYDQANRLVLKVSADHDPPHKYGQVAFGYNKDGTVAWLRDQNGHRFDYRIDFAYDGAKRLVSKTYPDGSTVAYAYDGDGRLVTVKDQHTQTALRRTYDALHRITEERQNAGGTDPDAGLPVRYTYDNANNVQTITYPGGRAITRVSDPRGLLFEVKEHAAVLAAYAYDGASRKKTRNLINGLTTDFDHDANGRISSLADALGPEAVNGYGYSYDTKGNVLLRENKVFPQLGEKEKLDGLNRMTFWWKGEVLNGGIPDPEEVQGWELSPEGDWQAWLVKGVTDHRTHSATHETLRCAGGAVNLAYDDNGNLSSDWDHIYLYDYENRLVEVKDRHTAETVALYGYDTLNRLVRRTTMGGKEAYYHDDWRCVEERDGKGAVIATNVFGADLDEVVERRTGDGKSFFPAQDERHGVTLVSDAAGNALEYAEYSPYGSATYHTDRGADGLWFTEDDGTAGVSSTGMPFAFTGQRFAGEADLLYFKNRWYRPWLGRFTSRDPLAYREEPEDEETSSCQGWSLGEPNLYQYVDGNPLNRTDPYGLKPFEVLGLGPYYMYDLYRGRYRARTSHPITKASHKCVKPENIDEKCMADFDYEWKVVVYMLIPWHSKWSERYERYDCWYGPDRSNLEEFYAALNHELDHSQTYLAGFSDGAAGPMNEAHGKMLDSEEECTSFVNCVHHKLLHFYQQAIEYSQKFDDSGSVPGAVGPFGTCQWKSGDIYQFEPFEEGLDLSDCDG